MHDEAICSLQAVINNSPVNEITQLKDSLPVRHFFIDFLINASLCKQRKVDDEQFVETEYPG